MHVFSPLFVACLCTLLSFPTFVSAAPILASVRPLAWLPNRQLPLARPFTPPALRFADEENTEEIFLPVKEMAVEESIFADFTFTPDSTSSIGQETKKVYLATATFRITPKESDKSNDKSKRSSVPKGKGKSGKHGKLSSKAKRELLERRMVIGTTTFVSATTRTSIPSTSTSSAEASAPALDTLAAVPTPSPVVMLIQNSADAIDSSRPSHKWVPYAAMAEETFGTFA